jgi:hypothetical protein
MGRWRPFSADPATVKVEATSVATPTPDPWEEISDPDLGRWPIGVLQYKPIILSAMEAYQIKQFTPKLFLSVIYKEGRFPDRCPDGPWTASCTSESGAIGPAQVMPFHFPEGVDGSIPAVNIPKGMELLRDFIKDAGGEVRKGLAFYNCGETDFDVNPSQQLCLNYADDVLSEYNSR